MSGGPRRRPIRGPPDAGRDRSPGGPPLTELELRIGAERALQECYGRGLVLRWRGPLPGHPGGQRWQLGLPGRSAVLELNRWGERTWVRLSNRAPAPVRQVARELADL